MNSDYRSFDYGLVRARNGLQMTPTERFEIWTIHASVRWNDFVKMPAVRIAGMVAFAIAALLMLWFDILAVMLQWPDGGFGK